MIHSPHARQAAAGRSVKGNSRSRPAPPRCSEPSSRHDVVVVGGGIAGLTAAYFLRKHDVILLEKCAVAGGQALCGEHGGVIYAKGVEYIGKPEGTLRKLIKKLGLKPIEIPDPMDAKFDGEHYWWGEDGIDLMFIQGSSREDFNRFMSTVMAYYDKYDEAPAIRLKGDFARMDRQSAREWFQDNGFGAVYQEYYNVAARGLYGASLDEISALSYIPEIGFDFEGCQPLRRRDVKELANSPARGVESTEAYTFRTGMTEVTATLAGQLGERLLSGAEVGQVARDGDDYLVYYTDATGAERLVAAQAVILAVPAPVTLHIAAAVLDDEQKQLLEQIPYAPYMTLALFSATPLQERVFDLAVPDGWFFTDLYDSTWTQRWSEPALPQGHGWVTSAYIAPHTYRDSDLLSLSDEAVLQRVLADLERLFPGAREKITGWNLQRFPHAYPVMVPGAYQRLKRLHKLNKGSLLLAGDYLIYPTLEAACDSGYLAAHRAKQQLAG